MQYGWQPAMKMAVEIRRSCVAKAFYRGNGQCGNKRGGGWLKRMAYNGGVAGVTSGVSLAIENMVKASLIGNGVKP